MIFLFYLSHFHGSHLRLGEEGLVATIDIPHLLLY